MDELASVEQVALAFGLDEAQKSALSRYVDLILSWREANVTSLRSRESVVRTLVADALSLLDAADAKERAGEPWVDLGAGAGIPGIPLAIALPGLRLTLVESIGKKCRFLEAAVDATDLAGRVRVACTRSESFARVGAPGREAFDVVVARAVAPLPALVELAAPLLHERGVLLASKTRRAVSRECSPAGHVAALCGLAFKEVVPLPRSPLQDAVCAIYEKTRPTPGSLPRREGLAAKRPLTDAGLPSSPSTPASIGDPAKGVR